MPRSEAGRDGAQMLDEVAAFLRRFVVFQQPEAADFLALWVMHTHAFEASITTPYARITSPERESAKTRTFEVLHVLLRRPWLNAVVSTAILFRKGDAEAPTLLLDEVDNIDFTSRAELLGVLNSGYRMGIKVSRCDEKGRYRDFDPFYPKAFAGIAGGKLPDTLHSRSVVVRLQRRKPDEPVERFFHHKADREAAPLREALEAWATEHLHDLAVHEPDLPDELGDRAQEVLMPLLAIADRAGAGWPERARAAAVALSSRQASDDDESMRVRLLSDIGEIFVRKGLPDVLFTQQLLDALKADETMPWASVRSTNWSGEGLRDRDLAAMLKPFAVGPHPIKIQVQSEVKVRRGYRRRQFFDAWFRYLGNERYQRYSVTSPENTGSENRDSDGEGNGVTGVTDFPGDSEGDSLFDPGGRNEDGEEMPF